MDLVIIEGVGKQDTIKKYLGKGYEVFATKGHVRDLPEKTLGVDVRRNFEPKYVIMPDKKDVVKNLKEKAQSAQNIYLATDPDREGEAISWHLRHILEIDKNKKCRIVFNEISKKAIDKALLNPRVIDQNLVDAQQARRVLDRLVGYQLSPYLNKKINKNHLSAGRVQSVALKIVCDREAEIENFKPVESYLIGAKLKTKEDKTPFVATLSERDGKKFKPANKEQADIVLSEIKGKDFVVSSIKKSLTKSSANPPFITSTMQQEALNKLGLSLKRTSLAAQQLYEGVNIKGEGKTALITYIRTDSTRISDDAALMAKEYIKENFGAQYVPEKQNVFKSRKNTQDAHEAIRPIHLELTPEKVKDSLEADQYKLYKLIFERFLASQMKEATFDSLQVGINCGNYTFKANGRTLVFAGHLKAYNYEENKTSNTDDEGLYQNKKLPKLTEGQILDLVDISSEQKFTKPPARYTDATLVKVMEEKGIGRPATYAPTIATLYSRLYVEKDGKNVKPTSLGRVVCDVLVKNFPDLINISFTAQMEDKLDNIEDGGKTWQNEIADFYADFEKELKKAGADTERVKIEPEMTDEKCEICGRPMVIRTGKFGKFLGCSGYPECKNIKKLEKVVGKCPLCGGDVALKKSKKGTSFYGCCNYPKCNFVSWNIPLQDKCPKCGKYLELKKTKEGELIVCSNQECDYKILKNVKKGEK